MIDVGISYGFGEDNRYNTTTIPPEIQLSTYKYDLYNDNKKEIFKSIKKSSTDVHTVHLPLDTFRRTHEEIFALIDECNFELDCKKFIVHPNKGVGDLLEYYRNNIEYKLHNYELCVETFQWTKKKELKSPLEIVETCLSFEGNVKMCIDTSHMEELWFDHKIIKFLLKHTSVIHLSNRSKKGQHLPFNTSYGDLNLEGFVKNLKYRYDWHGTIILEYMPEYQNRLLKNYSYIKRMLDLN